MKTPKFLPFIVLAAFALAFLAGCKAPDEMTPKGKDATSGAAKKAGGDEE